MVTGADGLRITGSALHMAGGNDQAQGLGSGREIPECDRPIDGMADVAPVGKGAFLADQEPGQLTLTKAGVTVGGVPAGLQRPPCRLRARLRCATRWSAADARPPLTHVPPSA